MKAAKPFAQLPVMVRAFKITQVWLSVIALLAITGRTIKWYEFTFGDRAYDAHDWGAV